MVEQHKDKSRSQVLSYIKYSSGCPYKACWLSYPSISSLKAVLSAPLYSGALDLSGIPLTARDMERLCSHLQRHASNVVSLELGFTELTDEAFLLLLPTLAALPHLETLALNGNRLTRTILKELTDALKVERPLSLKCFHIFFNMYILYY